MTLLPVYACGCQVWLHHRINTRYKNYQAILNCSQIIHFEGNLARIPHLTCKLPAKKSAPDGCKAHETTNVKLAKILVFVSIFYSCTYNSKMFLYFILCIDCLNGTSRWNRAAPTASMSSHKWPSWQQMNISYKSIPPSLISQPDCSRES